MMKMSWKIVEKMEMFRKNRMMKMIIMMMMKIGVTMFQISDNRYVE